MSDTECKDCDERQEALIRFQAQWRSAIDEAKQLRSDLLKVKDKLDVLQSSWLRQSTINVDLREKLLQSEARNYELDEIIDSIGWKAWSANRATVKV